ncbi:hypothetical protein HW555_013517 [Spodoptera exigua]|uniref:PHD-type domain-containing protein n=1 Tax=Spodoptera exigua TaxID=7107 RepID=A0A835KZQ8_SPOEX|nr:hypothetical protein HW555_013517 [Spodoptera exigua]
MQVSVTLLNIGTILASLHCLGKQPELKDSGTKSHRRMPEKATCFKCRKSVDIKETALCSICNHRYEFDCDGYPEGTYRLMDTESKKRWKCKTCLKNNKKVQDASNVTNITTRKKGNLRQDCSPPAPVRIQNVNDSKQTVPVMASVQNTLDILDSHILSECEISGGSYDTPNKLSKSVDGTISETLTILEMKDTIKRLTNKLDSTENELENTILENNNLRQQLDKLTTEIKLLKSLCHSSTVTENSPALNPRRKRHSLIHQRSFFSPSTPLPNSLQLDYGKNTEIMELNQKITELQNQLRDAQQQIQACKKIIDESKHTNVTSPNSSVSKINTRTSFHAEEPNHETSNRVLIFGSQQCVGLAAALIHSRRNTREKQRGGTCILIKKGISYKELPFVAKHASVNTFEACGIELTDGKLIIICIYRTPQSDPNQFLTKISSSPNDLENSILPSYTFAKVEAKRVHISAPSVAISVPLDIVTGIQLSPFRLFLM